MKRTLEEGTHITQRTTKQVLVKLAGDAMPYDALVRLTQLRRVHSKRKRSIRPGKRAANEYLTKLGSANVPIPASFSWGSLHSSSRTLRLKLLSQHLVLATQDSLRGAGPLTNANPRATPALVRTSGICGRER